MCLEYWLQAKNVREARAVADIKSRKMRVRSFNSSILSWLCVGVFSVVILWTHRELGWFARYPDGLYQPIVDSINSFMGWFTAAFGWFFTGLTWLLEGPMLGLQTVLQWLPWPAAVAAFTVLGFVAGGLRLAVFTLFALFYMVVTGYWPESMNTLALVGVSVPLSIALGFGLGVLAYRSRKVNGVIQPCLDLMQTVPTFAYLIPILLLFGFGPVVGLIASAIYACPPMVRNVIHGLRCIPQDVHESGLMCGSTKRQQFWWVEVPTALPQIMIGVNQTTMAALSMVIIAAIIGGFDDIGWEVLSTMRKAQFGQSLLSGLVIALMAMVMDRISWGFTRRETFQQNEAGSIWRRHRWLIIAVTTMAVLIVTAQSVPFLESYPKHWRLYPADSINDAMTYIVSTYGGFFDGIKKSANYFFLLPIKIGLINTIRPVSWGYDFTPTLQLLYWAVVATLASCACRAWAWRAAVSTLIAGTVLFFGLTNIPWPIFFTAIALVAWQSGGARVAAIAVVGMIFILLAGVWKEAMLSVYLCGAAVVFSFVAGGAIGVLAASNERVSRVVRVMNDTLQTMPQFVYLIPVLFLFQIGDFSALIAVIAYCMVPMIRYTEHGIRNIQPDVVEAAKSMGVSRRQMVFQIQLPMALPEIMLGLNQTIMYGLAMLVIAALVGTRGLGQSVYIALGKADAGKGLVAGLSIAIIAIVADRIIQAWVSKKKSKLGIL